MAEAGPAPRAFVAGWPVAHSRSPVIHRFWLAEHGLDGDYVRHAVEPAAAPAFLADFAGDGFIGGNVTIPHKQTAFDVCQRPDAAARRLGAVNTLWLEDGTVCGANTDGEGFLANLDSRAPQWDAPSRRTRGVLVLGAGGAARAIVDALVQRGFKDVAVANRTLSRAEGLRVFGAAVRALPLDADALGEAARRVSLVVNTTSLGMDGQGGDLPLDIAALADDAVATDIVYTPLMTPFLNAARDRGLVTVDGLGMLLHQAVPGFERWFGVRPTVTAALRSAVLRDMGLDA